MLATKDHEQNHVNGIVRKTLLDNPALQAPSIWPLACTCIARLQLMALAAAVSQSEPGDTRRGPLTASWNEARPCSPSSLATQNSSVAWLFAAHTCRASQQLPRKWSRWLDRPDRCNPHRLPHGKRRLAHSEGSSRLAATGARALCGLAPQ